ncbi:MAG TPA: alpha-hydroxy-acid oxidizing protein [Deinococcales bacterium]|nr:alpha-hydroxy-acid oxidizing protein [Deinococcales bacterium]
MYAQDLLALDALPLLPRLVHGAEEPDPTLTLFAAVLPAPFLAEVPTSWPGRVSSEPEPGAIWLVPARRMGQLMPLARAAGESGALAFGLDFAAPDGTGDTRPRAREDLAELKGACGLPFVVAGILDPRDVEASVEAGADLVVACSRVSEVIGGPSLPGLLAELRDAAAEVPLVARGGMRGGADALKYLALGADAVLLPSELNPERVAREFTHALRLTGCRNLKEVQYDLIYEPTFE